MPGSEVFFARRMQLPVIALVLGLVSCLLFARATVARATAIVACPSATQGSSQCLAAATGGGTTSPTGLAPSRIKSAYGWPTKLTAGAGKTIAIVDAK